MCYATLNAITGADAAVNWQVAVALPSVVRAAYVVPASVSPGNHCQSRFSARPAKATYSAASEPDRAALDDDDVGPVHYAAAAVSSACVCGCKP